MNRQPLPDFGQLSACLSGAARQIALVPNLPAINLDQRIAEQFQQLGIQMQNIQTQMQNMQTQMQNMQTQMQNMQTGLLERLDQHSERFTRLENTVSELKNDVTELKKDVAGLKRETISIGMRLDVSDANANARRHNSVIMNRETNYHPLRNRRIETVDGFPANGEVLANLNVASLTNLLQAFELDVDGNLSAKRKRFRNFIGIMIET